MGFVYALFHLSYTIPPAVLLTILYRPLFTKLDLYRIAFLITIAVVSTIPWDSYLIRNKIWSYPQHVIIGPTLFDIPLEEVFFFVIQTYNTSLLYIILSRPTFQPVYLCARKPGASTAWHFRSFLGQLTLLGVIGWGWCLVKANELGTYTGLIIVWAIPFVLLLWSLAYQFILGLPFSNTLVPIMLPTVYLWIIDTIALNRGTWVISTGTKYGVHLWDGLEIEEALFFLVTNTMIVFGQLAFDNALAIAYTNPHLWPQTGPTPSPLVLIQALLLPASSYDQARLTGLEEAVDRLKRKSRSFYLASSTFQGQLRIDLLLLYSFCRVADDLVDNASSAAEAQEWITKLHTFLSMTYDEKKPPASVTHYISTNFPPDTHSALSQLPISKLSRQPLQDLLYGFQMDLAFNTAPPIHTETDLTLYAERVAGTVAQLCIELIYHIYPDPNTSPAQQQRILAAGNRMGTALQYVNIARDIAVDATIGRVYLPSTWLADIDASYDAILKDPSALRVETLRARLLDKAFDVYNGARAAIEELPVEARGPIRVAVESYMEIGRVLRAKGYVVKSGRATVSRWRRVFVAWGALNR